MGNLFSRNLHAHVAAGNHDAVRLLNDGVQVLNAFRILNLGNHLHAGTLLIQHCLDFPDTIRGTHKGCRDKIKSLLDAKTDVFFILVGQGRKLNLHIGYIDALFLPQLAAVNHLTYNIRAVDLHHVHFNQAVVNQDFVAWYHILAQSAVIDVSYILIANQLAGGQRIGLAFL